MQDDFDDMQTPAFAIVRAVLIALACVFTLAFLVGAVMSVWPVLRAVI